MPDLTTPASGPTSQPATHVGAGTLGLGTLLVIAFLVLVGKLKRPTPAKTAVALPGGATVTITQTSTPTPTPPAVVVAVDDGADPMGAFATSWENVKSRYVKMKAQVDSATATNTSLRGEVTALRNELQTALKDRDALQAKLEGHPELDAADLAALDELVGKTPNITTPAPAAPPAQ